MSARDALASASLQEFWATVRRQLDRNADRRANTTKRPTLAPDAALALRTVLGDAYRSRIELDVLERELVVRGVGDDLDDALTKLGHPPSPDALTRRVDSVRRSEARAALMLAIGNWKYDWAQEWARGIVSSGNLGGLEPSEVTELVGDVVKVTLLAGREDARMARTDVAAMLFGDSHALDAGRRRTNWAERALRYLVGDLDGRELWEAAGLVPDRVSAPALVWGLDAVGRSPAARLLAEGFRAAVPVHLSGYALDVELGSFGTRSDVEVLVVENPRVVEYAAERRIDRPLIAGNGNPSSAVMLLIERLQFNGVPLRYHGDFDAAGLAICGRMEARGLTPWRMSSADYQAAIALGEDRGVRLGRDEYRAAATLWDPPLAAAFNDARLVVHEEFLLGTDLLL